MSPLEYHNIVRSATETLRQHARILRKMSSRFEGQDRTVAQDAAEQVEKQIEKLLQVAEGIRPSPQLLQWVKSNPPMKGQDEFLKRIYKDFYPAR